MSALEAIAVHRGRHGFSFDDLARAGSRHGWSIAGLADWLAGARRTGLLEELGLETAAAHGPRRYRIARSATSGDPRMAPADAGRSVGPCRPSGSPSSLR